MSKIMDKPATPLLTVDAVILYNNKKDIVLIKRKNPPFKNGYALPGGFVDVGETVEDACIREALEETNIKVKIIKLIGVFSDPKRDPRGHTVSVAFLCGTVSRSWARRKSSTQSTPGRWCGYSTATLAPTRLWWATLPTMSMVPIMPPFAGLSCASKGLLPGRFIRRVLMPRTATIVGWAASRWMALATLP